MKITLNPETVEVDESAWAAEFGIPVETVPQHVRKYFEGYGQYQVTECMGLQPQEPQPEPPDQLEIPGQVIKLDVAEWCELSGMPRDELLAFLKEKLANSAQVQLDTIYDVMTEPQVHPDQLPLVLVFSRMEQESKPRKTHD